MGRELKRVPLDFSWPLKKIWKHYLNPYSNRSAECPACDGTGYAPEAKRFRDEWYGHAAFDPVAYGAVPLTADHPKIREMAIRNVNASPDYYLTAEEKEARRQNLRDIGVDLMEIHRPDDHQDKEGFIPLINYKGTAVERETHRLFECCFKNHWSHHLVQEDVDALIEAERLWGFTRVPRTEEQREVVRKKIEAGGNSWLPESNGYRPTAQEVNDWSIGGIGHDASNTWICIKARCAREGFISTCPECKGVGWVWPDPQDRELAESWEPTEPPEGPGYQLWENTSEGSPVSPVFKTLDELCYWAEEHYTTFGSAKATKERWKEMLEDGLVYHQEGRCVFT